MIHVDVYQERDKPTGLICLSSLLFIRSIYPHVEMPLLIIRFIKIGTVLMAACVSVDFRQTILHY